MMMKYPLSKHHAETIRSKTGKPLSSIDLDGVMNGQIEAEDIKISADTLRLQAEVAKVHGKTAMAKNLYRAAEMTEIDDALILEVYDKLRPNRSTEKELLAYADLFEKKYKAYQTAAFIREAIEVYKKRDVLISGDYV